MNRQSPIEPKAKDIKPKYHWTRQTKRGLTLLLGSLSWKDITFGLLPGGESQTTGPQTTNLPLYLKKSGFPVTKVYTCDYPGGDEPASWVGWLPTETPPFKFRICWAPVCGSQWSWVQHAPQGPGDKVDSEGEARGWKKNVAYFPWNATHNWVVFHPLYTLNKLKVFFHCFKWVCKCEMGPWDRKTLRGKGDVGAWWRYIP